jgi:hypothetical protein
MATRLQQFDTQAEAEAASGVHVIGLFLGRTRYRDNARQTLSCRQRPLL